MSNKELKDFGMSYRSCCKNHTLKYLYYIVFYCINRKQLLSFLASFSF